MKITLISSLLALVSSAGYAQQPIELKQVTQDVTFLASDELNGRATFTKDIDKAAQYISDSFKQSGLVPFEGLADYKQSFSLFNVKPGVATVTVNEATIESDKVLVLSSFEQLEWKSSDQLNIQYIGEKDDFSKLMRDANRANADVLIVAHPAHQELFSRYKKHFAGGLNKFAINTGPSAVVILASITNVEQATISATTVAKKQSLANVVAVLPGSSKTGEIVLFSSHYDHLGVDASGDGDTIYNGADDDASGTTAIMNLARHYAKQGNNVRTLMFAAFTAEEIGGYGSQYFSNQLNPDDITAMVNIEMIGKASKFGAGTFWMTGFERSDLGEIFNRNLNATNQQVYPDPYPKQQLFYRSDNATLARLGVPAHSFSSTQLDKDQHYHQISDDISSLNMESMTQVINAIALASESLINGKDTPKRLDTSKVKKQGLIY